MTRRTSRLRATVAGALTGLALAAGGFLATMAIQEAASQNHVGNEVPVWARVMVIAPGIVGAGTVLAFPIAAAMVFTIVPLAKRWTIFDTSLAWVIAGVSFASPAAWLFSGMLENGRMSLFSIWSYGLILGGISGLMAWCFRHSKQGERSR